jgi:DNA-binding response OmpR family regulator
MSITPSCPALLVHEDDSFRRALIAALDAKHFSVTYTESGAEAVKAMREKTFKVVVLSVDVAEALEYLREHRRSGVILIAAANPDIRKYARVAEETLLKPVDPMYVAERASVYCRD